ncbi:PAS domain-containing protein [Mesorhizobium australicum]
MRRPLDKFRDDNLKLRLALRAAPLGIWDWNLETNEMSYSPRARAICGFSPDESITIEKVRAVTHPADLPVTSEQARMALDPEIRNNEPYEYRLVRADTGEIRWALAYGEVVFQRSGDTVKAVRFLGTIEDITARKQAENALREAELRQRLAIDAARMAVWELDVPADRLMVTPSSTVCSAWRRIPVRPLANFARCWVQVTLRGSRKSAAERPTLLIRTLRQNSVADFPMAHCVGDCSGPRFKIFRLASRSASSAC